MEKRYQVFVSSTFTDLKDERQAVLRAILELDQMPAGMELFPAADATAWQIIKDVIDSSDYYVLVIGGRYGSLDEEGIGYTEREYDYALSSKKPVIPFLHENPDNLPRERTETDQASWEKLKQFRTKIEQRHTCVYWRSPEDLKSKVIIGLTSATKRTPAIGWVRADRVPTEATIADLLSLRTRITELEAQIEKSRTSPPQGTEDLFQGNDRFEAHLSFTARRPLEGYPSHEDTGYSGTVEATWNEMFAAIAPSMINEASGYSVKQTLRTFFTERATSQWQNQEELRGQRLINFSMPTDELDTCMVQFRALGLIRENVKPRSVKDTQIYWTLTPYGDQLMTQLRALRRTPSDLRISTEIPVPSTTGTVEQQRTKKRSSRKLKKK